MVDKIKNLSLTTTKEQLNVEWSKILSRKNKMLQSSDWTQLEDVFISVESKYEWKEWRKKIRRIKKSNFRSPEDAMVALDNLENVRPVETSILESLVSENENREIIKTESKILEKVYVEKQPIILNQKITLDEFKSMFYQIFQDNPYDFQTYLKSIINSNVDVIFFDYDTIELSKTKAIKFLNTLQKKILEEKMDNFSNKEILSAKLEEALDYLTSKEINIEEYPLIDLYSQILNKDRKYTAMSFLDEKKNFNKILFDAERFLMYNTLRINNCDTLVELRELMKEIKNGY